jgi:hypothetical protein
VWHFSDISFSGHRKAVLTAPTNGTTNFTATSPFQWTAVSGAQGYYLWVGTSDGATNLVNTGEIQQTSYTPPQALPSGQTLYARIWTRIGGHWYDQAITFTASPPIAALTYPTNGATNVNQPIAFQWTSVPNVQSYYLWVGTAPGLKDVVDSYGTLQTSYTPAAPLPAGLTLYARMWTQTGGTWYYNDTTFVARPPIAALTYPADGATNVNQPITFQWSAVPNVQWYYLYVGTAPGLKDLIDPGGTLQTSYTSTATLPAGETLYVRLWTQTGGTWYYRDTTFVARPPIATLTYPANGATNVSQPITFQWTSVPNVQWYYLYVGTALGLKDVVDTYGTLQTSYTPQAPLPAGQTLYARMWTQTGGTWYYRDTTFSTLNPCDFSITAEATDTADAGVLHISTTAGCEWTLIPSGPAVALEQHSGSGSANIPFSFDRSVPGGAAPTIAVSGATASASSSQPPPFSFCIAPPPPCDLDGPICQAPPVNLCVPSFGRLPQPKPLEPNVVISAVNLETGQVTVQLFGAGDLTASALQLEVRGKTFSTARQPASQSATVSPTQSPYVIHMDPSLLDRWAKGEYSEVSVTWRGKTALKNVSFKVLGPVHHTQYNIPHEISCRPELAQAAKEVGTNNIQGGPNTCEFPIELSLRRQFITQTWENGHGIRENGDLLQYPGGCTVAQRAGANKFRPRMTVEGAFGLPVDELTLAVHRNNKDLKVNDPVLIVGFGNGVGTLKRVKDRCGDGCVADPDTHFDNFTNDPRCSGGLVGDLGPGRVGPPNSGQYQSIRLR